MTNEILLKSKLETLLQLNWGDIIDRTQILKLVLENARDSNYRKIKQSEIPPKQIKVTVTKFAVMSKTGFEIWVEFSVPKGQGVAIGTHVYSLNLEGEIFLKESYGTEFLPTSHNI